ncbi:hypothetical protein ACFRFL_39830 [Streptomyces sp. NPDC056708]
MHAGHLLTQLPQVRDGRVAFRFLLGPLGLPASPFQLRGGPRT